MAFTRGKTWIGLGVGAAALAALQQCDASLLKCFCDKDRCNTPECRIERRAPECECRFGHHQTSWTPWAMNCQDGACAANQYPAPGYANAPGAARGCTTEPVQAYAPQPYQPYLPEPTGPIYQQPVPGYEAYTTEQSIDPNFTAPPVSQQPSFYEQSPVGLPLPEPQFSPPQIGGPQTLPPRPDLPLPPFNGAQPQLPLPPDVISPMPPTVPEPIPQPPAIQPPAIQQQQLPQSIPQPGHTFQPGPGRPIPDSIPGALPQVVPGSVGDPANGFAPTGPTRSAIPEGEAFFRRLTPVQPTNHWQRGATTPPTQAQRMPYSAPQQLQQPQQLPQGRWRVMPGYQGSQQQPAMSQPFNANGGHAQ